MILAVACPRPSELVGPLWFPYSLQRPSRMMLPSLRFLHNPLLRPWCCPQPLLLSGRTAAAPSTIIGTTEASQAVSDPVNPLRHKGFSVLKKLHL